MSSTSSGMSVDTQTFLTLLVSQLKYQDPLSPQSDTEFVTQLAQMTSLQEIQNLNSSFASVQACNLVGKTAYAEVTDPDSGETSSVYGTVDSIANDDGTYYAIIGENQVAVGDILQVFDSDILSGGTSIAEASSLIGKTITGTYADSDGNAQTITGAVTSVGVKSGIILAYIGDTAVAVSNITGISV